MWLSPCRRISSKKARRCLPLARAAAAMLPWCSESMSSTYERSNSVTCVLMNGRDPETLRAYCNEKCGVILGHGIGELTGKAFRIAHMGHVNAPMILGTLSVVEMALGALGIPHGKGGAQAAIDWLSEQVKA